MKGSPLAGTVVGFGVLVSETSATGDGASGGAGSLLGSSWTVSPLTFVFSSLTEAGVGAPLSTGVSPEFDSGGAASGVGVASD
jgi:hypothetical protein